MVYREKEEISDVDEREKARYGSSIYSDDIIHKYDFMMNVCKRCISQCEEVVFSDREFSVPKDVLKKYIKIKSKIQ